MKLKLQGPCDEPASLLLVDDDEVFCSVLAPALQRRGFEVTVAPSVDQALDNIAREAPDFAVIDLCIGMDSGLTLVRRLAIANECIKTVVLTGYGSIATAVEAIKLGAVHYLTKPANADEIVAAFDRLHGDPEEQLSTRPLPVKRLEWEHLQKVLADHNGNISATARALGMHRRTLQRKLQKRPVKH